MLLIPKIHRKLLLQLVPISSCFAAKGPGLIDHLFRSTTFHAVLNGEACSGAAVHRERSDIWVAGSNPLR